MDVRKCRISGSGFPSSVNGSSETSGSAGTSRSKWCRNGSSKIQVKMLNGTSGSTGIRGEKIDHQENCRISSGTSGKWIIRRGVPGPRINF
jgi:hypothetical protein